MLFCLLVILSLVNLCGVLGRLVEQITIKYEMVDIRLDKAAQQGGLLL